MILSKKSMDHFLSSVPVFPNLVNLCTRKLGIAHRSAKSPQGLKDIEYVGTPVNPYVVTPQWEIQPKEGYSTLLSEQWDGTWRIGAQCSWVWEHRSLGIILLYRVLTCNWSSRTAVALSPLFSSTITTMWVSEFTFTCSVSRSFCKLWRKS